LTGNQIGIARQRAQGADTIIAITPFVELSRNKRSTDFIFGYLPVKLDAQGNGSAQIIAIAED
jgi:hypothetical protein